MTVRIRIQCKSTSGKVGTFIVERDALGNDHELSPIFKDTVDAVNWYVAHNYKLSGNEWELIRHNQINN